MIINGSFAMLRNIRDNKFHPVLFGEYPMPGPYDPNGLVRMKSISHHTNGFDTREEAIANMVQTMKDDPSIVRKQSDESDDILWDGKGTPAMVAFLQDNKLVLL